MPDTTAAPTSADFFAGSAQARQRLYELLADVLLSIAAEERRKQAA
jgi:hypothetical protein